MREKPKKMDVREEVRGIERRSSEGGRGYSHNVATMRQLESFFHLKKTVR